MTLSPIAHCRQRIVGCSARRIARRRPARRPHDRANKQHRGDAGRHASPIDTYAHLMSPMIGTSTSPFGHLCCLELSDLLNLVSEIGHSTVAPSTVNTMETFRNNNPRTSAITLGYAIMGTA